MKNKKKQLETQNLSFCNNTPDNSTSPYFLCLLRELFDQGLSVRVTVTGESMRPFMQGGESVILHRVQPEALRIGDLILFVDTNKRPFLHRIVCRKTQRKSIKFQTKGDGLSWLDAPLIESQVLGRVEKVFFPEPGNSEDHAICLNLNHYRHRVNAVYLAKRSFGLWYYNRCKKLLLRIVAHGQV